MVKREGNHLIYYRPDMEWWDTVRWTERVAPGDTPFARRHYVDIATGERTSRWQVQAKPPPWRHIGHATVAEGLTEEEAKRVLEQEVVKMRLMYE